MYSHSRKPPYPLEHHSKGITDNETSADQCDTLSLLIYALMKCVQQLTQVIKVPTGDYVQRKTNDQNEQKWLEEEKDDDIQLGDNSDPTVRPSHLCVPPFLSSNSQDQRGKIPTHTLESVCRKAAWISPSLSPLILTVSCHGYFSLRQNTPWSGYWNNVKSLALASETTEHNVHLGRTRASSSG